MEALLGSSSVPWAGCRPSLQEDGGFPQPAGAGEGDSEPQPGAGRAAAALMENPFPAHASKAELCTPLKAKLVWVEESADLPYQGDDKSRPNAIKLLSLFCEVLWSFPVTIGLEEMF